MALRSPSGSAATAPAGPVGRSCSSPAGTPPTTAPASPPARSPGSSPRPTFPAPRWRRCWTAPVTAGVGSRGDDAAPLGAGIVALDRRPGNVIGPLMVAFAVSWFLGNWGNRIPVFPTLGFLGGLFGAPLLVHSTLAYPSGRLRTRLDRVVLAAMYAQAAAVGLVGLLTFPRRGPGCGRCPWTPLFFPSRTVFTAVNRISDRSALVVVPLVLAALWLRWRGASRGARRELAPLWAAASILAVVYLLGAFA